VDQKERFAYLFRLYVKKRCTVSEKQELMGYIHSGNYDSLLKQLISEQLEQSSEGFSFLFHYPEKEMEDDAIETFAKIQGRLYSRKVKRRRWIMIAATLLFFLTSGVWLMTDHTGKQQTIANSQKVLSKNEIPPGSNKALLTLANGKTIALDSVHIGQMVIQGNRRIRKIGSGLLSYRSGKAVEGGIGKSVHYNTLSTPRGGQYRLILPDGSKVWINSASSIKFPTAFNGNYREVEMQGQCYFEIAKNPSKPFKVTISSSGLGQKGAEVLVLGTHFDVMAYPDEPEMNISLLEGSVKVKTAGDERKEVVIVPGQQAQVNKEGQIKLAEHVDMEAVVAWKDGFFEFGNTSLPVIMRQLARWYGIEIVYQQQTNAHKRFGGIISRNLPLSEILRMLEANGVHCQLQGHKLIVKRVE
jgi:ferric-dicitrate binding protein FerR (iron transport regulator)